MTHIPDSMMGEDSLVGWSLSDLNPITHLKTRARQLANAAMFVRRAGARLDPVSLVMNRLPGYHRSAPSAPQAQSYDDSQQQQPDDSQSQFDDETAGEFAIGCAEKINGLSHHARFHAVRDLHRHAMMGGDFAIGAKTEAVLAMTPGGSAILQANRLAKMAKGTSIFSRAAKLLQRAKSGDKHAKLEIKKHVANAKAGDPKAKANAAALKKVDDMSKMNTIQRGLLTLSEWYRAGIS
jgi:hypothetical protein